jgi:hypothetical protein
VRSRQCETYEVQVRKRTNQTKITLRRRHRVSVDHHILRGSRSEHLFSFEINAVDLGNYRSIIVEIFLDASVVAEDAAEAAAAAHYPLRQTRIGGGRFSFRLN